MDSPRNQSVTIEDGKEGAQVDIGVIPPERTLTTLIFNNLPSLIGEELCSTLEVLPSHLQERLIKHLYGKTYQGESKWQFHVPLEIWAPIASAYAHVTPKPAWFAMICARKHRCIEKVPGLAIRQRCSDGSSGNVCQDYHFTEWDTSGGLERLKWLQTSTLTFVTHLQLYGTVLNISDLYEISKIRKLQTLHLAKTAILDPVATIDSTHFIPLIDTHIRNLIRYARESDGFPDLRFFYLSEQPRLTFDFLDHCRELPSLQNVAVNRCPRIFPTKTFNFRRAEENRHFRLQMWRFDLENMQRQLLKGYNKRLKEQGDVSERQVCSVSLTLTHSHLLVDLQRIDKELRELKNRKSEYSWLLWWKEGSPPTKTSPEPPIPDKVSSTKSKQGQIRGHLKRKATEAGFDEIQNYTKSKPSGPPPAKSRRTLWWQSSPSWFDFDDDAFVIRGLDRRSPDGNL